MEQRVVKIVKDSFTGSDDKEVTGYYLYLVPVTAGEGAPERIFISDEKAGRMDFPRLGEHVYVFKNQYGRVIDLVRAGK